MQRVQVSVILKPRGLRGELKCTALPYGISPKVIFIDGQEFKVVKQSEYDNFTYFMLAGVDTFEVADRLRNKAIEIDRADLNIAHDEILTTDLIGMVVLDEHGKQHGVVKSVENYGAGEIIDCGAFSFPYEDEFIIATDMKKRALMVRVQDFL